MSTLIDAAFLLLSLPVLACCLYLGFLTLCSRMPAPLSTPLPSPPLRFAVVVPAHNEAAGIEETVRSLQSVDYPATHRLIVVVADNCSDDTAALAEKAGAKVLVRVNREQRGKGFALAYAFETIEKEDLADAIVVVDADTSVSPNLLSAFARRFAQGAHAIQADYAVRNRNDSWRTRLMAIALALFHILRSLGRENLGVSAGLRGNGMAFSRKVLQEVPHDAFSIVEDVEYGIKLGRAGHRVHYAYDAHVYGEMVPGEKNSRSQRDRWERGRKELFRQNAFPLLRDGLVQRNGMLLDLAMDVIVPPLVTLVLWTTAFAALSIAWTWTQHRPFVAPVPWLVSLACIALYVLRGWVLSGQGLRAALDLAWAPVYILWKVGMALKPKSAANNEWVRTARDREQP